TFHMDRPQIYFSLLPLSFTTLILYLKVLFVLWKRRNSYNTLFYKLIRTQAIFDISYVIVFFVFEIPQDWPQLQGHLQNLNNTPLVQLMYAHSYTCVVGQSINHLSMVKVMAIHLTPPLLFGLFIFYWEIPSLFLFVPSLHRMTRVTEVFYVQINSITAMTTSISGALISSCCYILIFLTLRKRFRRSWNREVSILFTSFILFLCLCALTVYFLCNGLLSMINWEWMSSLRMHYYAFSFPISLLNPWCLLMTSPKIRQDVLGKCLSQTAVMRLLPARVPPKAANSPRGASDGRRSSS
ncbi:hypothetical protein PMAYCL1PPCAC_17414, partial [Pristionchus mayeri]